MAQIQEAGRHWSLSTGSRGYYQVFGPRNRFLEFWEDCSWVFKLYNDMIRQERRLWLRFLQVMISSVATGFIAHNALLT